MVRYSRLELYDWGGLPFLGLLVNSRDSKP
jgi:hypothetical protein